MVDPSPGGSTVNKTDVVPALSGSSSGVQDGPPMSKQANQDLDKGVSDSARGNEAEKPP